MTNWRQAVRRTAPDTGRKDATRRNSDRSSADRPDRSLPSARATGREIVRTSRPRRRRTLAARRRRNRSAPPPSAPGDIRVIVNALGTVTPLATVTVQTQINGQLIEVGFTEGQLVKKGDFLAQIDRPALSRSCKPNTKASSPTIRACSRRRKSISTRYQTLAEQNSIARQQAEDQVFIVQQYQGTVKLDQAQIDQQKLEHRLLPHRFAGHRPRRPAPGRSGKLRADRRAAPASRCVTQLQPITVIFPIPEDDLPDIMPQFNAGTPLEVTAYRPRQCQAACHRPGVGARQPDRHHHRHGEGARAVRQSRQRAVSEPVRQRAASGEDAARTSSRCRRRRSSAARPGTYVYVVNADNTVSVRPIKIGPTDGRMAAVNSGLSAGERVVVDGTDRLRDGCSVSRRDARRRDGRRRRQSARPARQRSARQRRNRPARRSSDRPIARRQ